MVEIALGRPHRRALSRIQRAGRRRLHRPGAQGAHRTAGRRGASSPSRWCGPACASGFARDLQAMRAAARLFERFVPEARRLQARRGRRDAGPLRRRSRWICASRRPPCPSSPRTRKDDPDFRVPKPEWDLTARDVLTTEWIDGIRLNDLAAIEAAGHDRVALGRTVIQSFLRHAIRDGFFHADMHPGQSVRRRARAGSSRSISASWAGSA